MNLIHRRRCEDLNQVCSFSLNVSRPTVKVKLFYPTFCVCVCARARLCVAGPAQDEVELGVGGGDGRGVYDHLSLQELNAEVRLRPLPPAAGHTQSPQIHVMHHNPTGAAPEVGP